HVANDRVVPIEEVESTIRADAKVRGPEVRVRRGEQAFLFGADKAGSLVLELVLKDALEADDVADQQVALHRLREVPAGEELHAGTGPRPLLIDLRWPGVLLGKLHTAGEQRSVVWVGAGAVHDDVLTPVVERMAVRVGEWISNVHLELLGAGFVA